ncbi:MAG: hypothetical protein WBB43_27050 [Limnoraphis sp.]
MPDRLTVDIEGYRKELEAFAAKTERTINQTIRFFIKESLDRRQNPHKEAARGAEGELALAFLKKLTEDQKPTPGEIMLLAKTLKVSPDLLMRIKKDGCESNSRS